MTLYPDVAKKAQAEIDAIVGHERLPDFSDRQNLPYVDALVKEVFRWNAVVPTGMLLGYRFAPISHVTGVPHRALEDNVYNGYFIPKGSLLIANIW